MNTGDESFFVTADLTVEEAREQLQELEERQIYGPPMATARKLARKIKKVFSK